MSNTQLSTVIKDKEHSGASKMLLVAELKQKDPFGKPLFAIPSSKGRYQPIGAEDDSLRPIATDDDNENPSNDVIHTSNESNEINQAAKEPTEVTTEKNTVYELGGKDTEQNPGESASTEKAGAEPNMADDSVKRDSLVATTNVVTNLMKWQLKSKKQAGVKLKSMEKYKGHLEVIQRRSRQEQVELPFPIRLNIKREVLPIIHNVVEDYKLALGPNHKLTRVAMAKEKQLQSELTEGDEVVL